jgi:hypothetical protein
MLSLKRYDVDGMEPSAQQSIEGVKELEPGCAPSNNMMI